MNWYGFWADVIVAVHVGYVGFIVIGQLAILVGLALRRRWARNPWFRSLHLAAVLLVAYEFLLEIECPFTVWERNLRALANQEVSQASFMGRCLHNLILHDPEDMRLVNIVNASIGILVVLTFAVFPPRFRKAKLAPPNSNGPLTAPPCAG
ncbi:MAG TPA: DUF2784 domain-containing protein [Gemmataceae bacterium]|jgi:hypothetical protein|nr:DUF2784 domain-containing protein [Gemmataceae bacterium]